MVRGIEISRSQLESWAGHDLTDDTLERLRIAIEYSSIPDAIAEIVFQILPPEPEEEV